MKLKELLSVCPYSAVHLHNGFDGKLVAKTRKSLEAYRDVEVRAVYEKIECDRDGAIARPYLYVYGSSYDIDCVKKGQPTMWDRTLDLTTLQELLCDINPAEIESHLTDGTTLGWLKSWRKQADTLVNHLLAKEKVNSSETDKK